MTVAPPGTAPDADRRPSRLSAATGLSVGGAAVVAAFAIPQSVVGEGPVLCPFRLATGLPCPGCGLTRSWVAVAHGDLSTAFADNVFGPVSFVAVVLAVITVVVLRLFAPSRVGVLATVARSRVVYAVAAVWVVYGVVRAVDAAVGMGWFPAVT